MDDSSSNTRHMRTWEIKSYNDSYLSIRRDDVLTLIQSGHSSWEKMVPDVVAEIIKAKNLFGCREPAHLAA